MNSNTNNKSSGFVESVAGELGVTSLEHDDVMYLENELKFRLRQIIQESLKFARHSHRTKVIATDVDCTFRMKNIVPVIGTFDSLYLRLGSSSMAANDLDKNILFKSDPILKLKTLQQSNLNLVKPPNISVSVQWIAIDGIVPKTFEKVNEKVSNTNENDHKNEFIATDANDARIKTAVSHPISKEQQIFFTVLCQSILNFEEDTLSVMLKILESTDAGLARLVPNIVCFVTKTILDACKSGSHISDKTSVGIDHVSVLNLLFSCLSVFEALIESKYLCWHLESYLQQMIPAILTCACKKSFGKNESSQEQQHWQLRSKAATLVRLVVNKFHNKYPSFSLKLKKKLKDYIVNYKKISLTTLYGVVMILKNLGFDAMQSILIPYCVDLLQNWVVMKMNILANVDVTNRNKVENFWILQETQYEARVVFDLIKECVAICWEKFELKMSSNGDAGIEMKQVDENDAKLQRVYAELRQVFNRNVTVTCNQHNIEPDFFI